MLSICLAVLDTEDDKSLFRRLYEEHRQEMYAVAYKILHNAEDAEDAVHQAFLKIADHFEKIKEIPCQEMGAYIVMISRNVSINLYNSNKRRAEHSAVLHEETVALDADLLEQVTFEELVKTISGLPQIYQDVLFLYHLQGFSAKEIADMFGITVSTVWKRMERAKKLLREALERGGLYVG